MGEGMAFSKLIAGGIASLLVALSAGQAAAGFAAGAAIQTGGALDAAGPRLEQRVLHRHRVQSFYCYPKNYWWFYRPYTTAFDGHARCMPYFHVLGPDARRNTADQYIK